MAERVPMVMAALPSRELLHEANLVTSLSPEWRTTTGQENRSLKRETV